MFPLATPYYKTIIENQTNNMFQSNNEERKIACYDVPTDFPSESQKHKNSSSKALNCYPSCLEVASDSNE